MTIDKYINDLSWYQDEETIQKAIKKLSNMDDLDLKKLILPMTKGHWDNAAIVINSYCDNRLIEILPELLVWLQDLNWPGAISIKDRIILIDPSRTMPIILTTIEKAMKLRDEMWVYWLEILKEEIEEYYK